MIRGKSEVYEAPCSRPTCHNVTRWAVRRAGDAGQLPPCDYCGAPLKADKAAAVGYVSSSNQSVKP